MTSYKFPPDFAGKTYEAWRREVSLWQHVTDLDIKKQAAALALSLTGQYRDIATSIDDSQLNCDDGVKNLLETLDKTFKKNSCDLAYESYKQFEHYRRCEDSTMLQYILRRGII